MMKKLLFPVAVFSCLIFLRAAFAQGPDESAEPTRMTVPFRGDIVIEMESLENTDEALTLTLLYGSGDPAEIGSANLLTGRRKREKSTCRIAARSG